MELRLSPESFGHVFGSAFSKPVVSLSPVCDKYYSSRDSQVSGPVGYVFIFLLDRIMAITGPFQTQQLL